MSRAVPAIVCPGQGSQHPGMLEGLPGLAHVERLIDAAEAMSELELRLSDRLGSAEDLADTRVAQPLLFLADWAWGRALLDAGVEPVALAGHSLGEFAALALADVFSVEAGLQLVVERAGLMATVAASRPGAMAAVLGLDAATVEASILDIEDVWLANDNCPGQVVVSGTEGGVEEASSALSGAGARRVVRLAVSGGFHSPLMTDAASAFADTLADTDLADASRPVVQNTAPARPVTDAETVRANLVEQMTSPVRWTETMVTLRDMGADTLVEAGPGKVLAGLAKRAEGIRAVSAESTGMEALIEEVSA